MVNVVSMPGFVEKETSPPMLLTIVWIVARPMPSPWPTSLVVKNGWNMRLWHDSGIPPPVSWTETQTWPFTDSVRIVIFPFGLLAFMASMALRINPSMQCPMFALGHFTLGRLLLKIVSTAICGSL